MQKPDANGYVNITWPSKSIPHGGIFHTRVVEPSAAQREFLKVLIDESKLTNAQRRKSAWQLREEQRIQQSSVNTPPAQLVRPHTSRRRSLSAIRDSVALDVDQYRPLKRGEDREKLKEQLANRMTYGEEEQKQATPPKPLTKPGPKLPTKKEQWNDLVTQVRERAVWLAEMEVLGHADPHRELIKDQIAERLRAMDALGVESQCSTARSVGSGFSVIPSERSKHSDRSDKPDRASGTRAIKKEQKTTKKSAAKQEEHVAEYERLSPLQYTPRRRV